MLYLVVNHSPPEGATVATTSKRSAPTMMTTDPLGVLIYHSLLLK